jgi:hypothetical protein
VCLIVGINKGQTTSEYAVEDYTQIWGVWNITFERSVHFLITETAANTNTDGRLIQGLLYHLYCLDHTLQLTANIVFMHKIFGTEDDIDDKDLLLKCRMNVIYFNKSTQANDDLKTWQKSLHAVYTATHNRKCTPVTTLQELPMCC